MKKIKRLFTAILSMLLAASYTLGVFSGIGYRFVRAASNDISFSLDQKDGSVKTAKQKISGNLKVKDEKAKITYQVYSEIDEGNLSYEGEAVITNGSFNIDILKLKPHANKIIVTVTTPDGKEESRTLNIDYDSSSIKASKLKNLKNIDYNSSLQFVDNNLLVFFEDGISDEKRQDVIDTVGGKCVGYINGINMWQIEIEPGTYKSLDKTAKLLTASDDVQYAGYNMAQAAKPMVAPVTPADPWYGASWSEYNPRDYNWSVEAVQALSAWGYDWAYNHINVGIVDAGVNNEHEDLSGKVFFPDAASAAENDAADDHGTHVAGIMGAIANNSKGVTGILWDTNMYCVNWDVLVGTDANLLAGLTETVQAGAKVVNFSLGLANDISYLGEPSVNTQVIHYANLSASYMKPLIDAGYEFIVCQSAGNGQGGYSQDAIYNGYFCSITSNNITGMTTAMKTKINERIIIVGSAERLSTLSFQQAEYSNAGSQVDICAPGDNIFSSYATIDNENRFGLGYYGYMSGTSMASPLAAAVAALTWSVNPALTGAQVRTFVLYNTSYNVADNPSVYHPLVNTYRMVNAKLAVEAVMAQMNPDYSAVHTAVTNANAIDTSLYTAASLSNLTSAVNAVDYNLQYKDQPTIDGYAHAINNAIAALEYKTVSYTVQYRLNAADGARLIENKTGTGQVTTTVTETAPIIDGYSPMDSTQSLLLGSENNLIIFVYIARPGFNVILNTYKEVSGGLVPVTAVKPGDIITVKVTPTTNFYCGASRIVVMYDKSFYTISGNGTTAFTVNPESAYNINTVTSYGGLTTSPLTAWPSTFSTVEKSLYNFTMTTFNAGLESANGGYPTVINDGKWLFSFKLEVKANATGSGRIFMDDRWTQSISNPTGPQYFSCCANAATPSYSGTTAMDFLADLTLADRILPIGVSVSFDLNSGNGTVPLPLTGLPGETVTLPAQNDIDKQYYSFLGWAAAPNATQPLESFSIPSLDSTLYAVWSKIPVALTPSEGSSTVIDPDNGFIYGLEPGLTKSSFETNFINIIGSGQLEYSTISETLGTGVSVDLIDNETQEVLQTFIIVIFGDVNGDGNITGIDAGVVIDVENYMLGFNEITDAAFIKAGDLNLDGNINGSDAGIMVNIENYAANIDQTTGAIF